MPCDDTRGNIWTIAGAWEGMASGGSAPRGQFLDVRLERQGDRRVVAGRKRSGWHQLRQFEANRVMDSVGHGLCGAGVGSVLTIDTTLVKE
jgi:hypothetical protein